MLRCVSVDPVNEEKPEDDKCQTIWPVGVKIVPVILAEAPASGHVILRVTARSNKNREKHPGKYDNEPHQCGVHVGKRVFLHK